MSAPSLPHTLNRAALADLLEGAVSAIVSPNIASSHLVGQLHEAIHALRVDSELTHGAAVTRPQMIALLERVIRGIGATNAEACMLIADLRGTITALEQREDLRPPPPGVSREQGLRASESDRKRMVARVRG